MAKICIVTSMGALMGTYCGEALQQRFIRLFDSAISDLTTFSDQAVPVQIETINRVLRGYLSVYDGTTLLRASIEDIHNHKEYLANFELNWLSLLARYI